MKAISELNEAKFNLEQTQTGTKYVSDIDNKINELKNYFESQRKSKDISDIKGIEIEEGKQIELSPALAYEYMDKCNKEERRNNFKKAIECATTAKEIFTKLGSEWSKEIITITRHISTLENKQVAREESFKRKREELEQKEQALKQEEEEFKKQMTARKEARRQKLRDLLKEK
jgi:hypothetical protein